MKIAKENNWGLGKKSGSIYLYNGCYWEEIDKERFQDDEDNATTYVWLRK
jgi:putative DNA primase/helicase